MRLSLRPKLRAAAVTASMAAAVVLIPTTQALATIGLPHNYVIDYITGADTGGVDSDKFYTNANGKVCFTASFKVHKNLLSGGTPDLKYRIQLWQNNTVKDTLIDAWTLTSGTSTYKTYGKICTVGLGSNKDYHLHWAKVLDDTGSLEGKGTISLS